jgi:hypothetical protein
MSFRLRLYDLRQSRFPRVLGLCQDNIPEIANYANSIQETLLFDKSAGDESWHGTWAEIAFNVSRENPFVVLPREIARIESADICNKPVPVNNQFAEFLRFGNGRMARGRCGCGDLQVYARNNAITFFPFTNPPQYLRVYITSDQDVGKRVMFGGLDENNSVIYSQDNLVRVQGVFLSMMAPFAQTTQLFNEIQAIQKDITSGIISIYQVDPNSGDEVLLLTMQPGETIASYRRYYFNQLPMSCCSIPSTSPHQVQIKAIAKLEPLPVRVDTDYLLLTSLEAFIEEAQALRLQEADTGAAQQMAAAHHMRAIRLLIGQLGHFNGIKDPAIEWHPFGSASLDKVCIGMT